MKLTDGGSRGVKVSISTEQKTMKSTNPKPKFFKFPKHFPSFFNGRRVKNNMSNQYGSHTQMRGDEEG